MVLKNGSHLSHRKLLLDSSMTFKTQVYYIPYDFFMNLFISDRAFFYFFILMRSDRAFFKGWGRG